MGSVPGAALPREAGRRVARLVLPGRLPDWIIAGVQKAGTTTLHHQLHRSPRAVRPTVQEVHYFTAHWDRGEAWYRRHFFAVPGTMTGETTPAFLFHPHAAARAMTVVPEARFVLVLRDPVERAWSHWRHSTRKGYEPLSFPDALDAEADRLVGADVDDHGSSFYRHSYVRRGMYAEQLERLFDHVPRERVWIIQTEQLAADETTVIARTCQWLGLPPPRRLGPARNVSPPHSPIDPRDRARLQSVFADANRRLYRLLGTDFGWPAS